MSYLQQAKARSASAQLIPRAALMAYMQNCNTLTASSSTEGFVAKLLGTAVLHNLPPIRVIATCVLNMFRC